MNNNYQKGCCTNTYQPKDSRNSYQPGYSCSSYQSKDIYSNSSLPSYTNILVEGILPIAMGYVPWQKIEDRCSNCLYDLNKGFTVGTIFPELDKPFLGRGMC